jgi:hypothetical protein
MSHQEEKVLGDVKSFTVDRSKWIRGQGNEKSYLLLEDGSMCCLGFYGEACGVDRHRLLDRTSPSNILTIGSPPWDTILIHVHPQGRVDTAPCIDLMTINDDTSISDDVRELRLTEIFKQIGIEVVFI